MGETQYMEHNDVAAQHFLHLYDAFCEGDQLASKELVNEFSARVLNYMRRAFSESQANDYVQSTWLKLFEYCGKALKHNNFGAFIMSVAKNIAIDEYRKHKSAKRSDSSKYQIETSDLSHNRNLNPECIMQNEADEQQRNAKFRLFKESLMQLPIKQRQVLHLQNLGHSLSEISEITGEKKETVKSQLRYAKNKLKELLGSSEKAPDSCTLEV